jgi:hypothetical protein
MPLMSYSEYAKTRHKTPYELVISSSGKSLYYFGERHSFDPKDEQWDQVKTFWNKFMAQPAEKRVVLTEGGVRPIEKSEAESIVEHGGMGLVTHLATLANIPIRSPEPDEAYERSELEKEFFRDEIQYYYFARVVHQWSKKLPQPDFEAYMASYLETDKRRSGWDGYDFSLNHMKEIHEKLFGKGFDPRDDKFFYDVSNPADTATAINRVSSRSSVIRDLYIVREIEKYWKDGYSIFAQFGWSHVVMQEPLLKELLV